MLSFQTTQYLTASLCRSVWVALTVASSVLLFPNSIAAEDLSTDADVKPLRAGVSSDLSDLPDSPEYRMLKSISGIQSMTMGEAERALAREVFFANLSIMMPLMDACSNEIESVCDRADNPMTCLVENVNSLGRCCASQVRSATGNSALSNSTFHNDVLLPVGSSLEFDSSCTVSKANLSRKSKYQSTELSAGPTFFDQDGNVELTQILGDVTWQGLTLAEQQPPTRIHPNGTPEYIRLSGQSSFNGIDLGPMQLDVRNSIEETDWQTATIDTVFYFYDRSGISRDPGTTTFHSNGLLARGKLTKSVTVKGVPLASGITTFAATGKVLIGTLASEYQHDELTLSKGPVVFNDAGLLMSAHLANEHLYGAYRLAADELSFHENGELKQAFLTAGSILNDNPLPRKARVTFNEAGTLETIAIPWGDPSSQESRKFRVTFNEAGKSETIPIPSGDEPTFKFGGYELRPNWPYSVHGNGQLRELRFQEHTVYRETLYPRNTQLKFDLNGEVTWDSFYDDVMQNEHQKQLGKLPELLPFSQVRQGVFLPKGSIVYSGNSGNAQLAIIPRPVQFNEFILAPYELHFSRHGMGLTKASLHGDQAIGGITLQGYPENVYLNEKGHIIDGQLAGDQSINGVWFADKSKIRIGPNQRVSQGTLARATVLDGIELSVNSEIKFHKNGRLKQGKLEVELTRDGLMFKKGSSIALNNEGHIIKGTVAHDQPMFGTILPANTVIRLSEGKLESFSLKHATEVQDYSLDGRKIGFHKNGILRTGILAKDTNVNGDLIVAGSQLLFDQQGQLLGSDFEGTIAPPEPVNDQAGGNSSDNAGFTVIVGREVVPNVVLAPPTRPTCEKLLSSSSRSAGFGNSAIPDTLKRKCRAFYAEYSE